MTGKRMTVLAVTAVAALVAGLTPASGYSTPLVSQENVRHIGAVPGSTGGHSVAVGNRLYVGAYGLGMRIFNISDPRNPQQIGQYFPGPQGAADLGVRADAVPDAAVLDGRHIATLNGTNRAPGTQQTEFLDVTDPANPVLLHRFTGPAEGESHNGDIARQRRLWLPSGGNGVNGFRIYDMSPLLANPPQPPTRLFNANPHAMWLNSQYKEHTGAPNGAAFNHTHDLEIYEDLNILLPPWEWEERENEEGELVPFPTYGERDIVLLAAATGYTIPGDGANDGAVYVIDITDPTAPEVINKIQNPAAGSNQIRYLHEVQFLHGDQNTIVVTDEDLHNGCDSGRMYTFNISDDLMSAEKLAEWAIGEGQLDTPTCMGSHVFSSNDQHVFMGAYTSGLQIIDLRDPGDPKRAGRYIPEGANSWGALYHQGVIYLGDFGARGLDVLEFIKDPDAKAFVAAGHPATQVIGVSEAAAECDAEGAGNGVDGFWVDIPPTHADGESSIRARGSGVPDTYDIDIYFYDAGCGYMAEAAITNEGSDEEGPIPEGAAHAFVALWVGAPQWVYVDLLDG